MLKIFIYNVPNVYLESAPEFEECTSIFTIFHAHFLDKYTIVENIEDADFAYIPFSIASLFVINSIEECKEMWIEIYEPIIHHHMLDKVPHILIWGYVLYHIDLTFINSKIYIISLESEGDSSISCHIDRLVVVPYILDVQTNACCNNISRIDNYKINSIYEDKQLERLYDIGYVGRLLDTNRNIIIDYLENEFTILKYMPSEEDPFEIYKNTKFTLVLRGDTPTRKAFFHALAAGSIPIIYESTLLEYDYTYFGMFESLRDLCICIPDHHDNIDSTYLSYIKHLIRNSLNNYQLDLNKYKEVFSRYNYYDTIHNISKPVYYTVKSVIDKHKNIKYKHNKFPYIYVDENMLEPIQELLQNTSIKISKHELIDLNTISNNGYGVKYDINKYQTSQYNLEVMFYDYMIKYPYRTKCYDKADLVYIPCYPFLKSWTTRDYFFDIQASVSYVQNILQSINISENKQYFIVYSDVMWPDARVFLNNIELPTNIKIVAFDTISDNRIIKAPYPCELHIEEYDWKLEWLDKQRDILLCYYGRERKELLNLYHLGNSNIFKMIKVDMNGWKSANEQFFTVEIEKLYRNSIFSLQPHGDMPTRRGFYHSIIYGCIPVIFTNNKDSYNNVNYIEIEKIAVILESSDNIIEKLNSIKLEKIEYYRNNISKIVRQIQYSVYFEENDAYSCILKKLNL